jgi:hypothetical protein
VANASLAMGEGSSVPGGTSVSLRTGFWLALAGYILIAVGGVLGSRRRYFYA